MKLTKEQVIKKIKSNKYLSNFPEYNDDKDVVLAAVRQDGFNLEYASERLRDDKGYLEFASKEIRNKEGNNNPINFLEK